MLKSIQSEYSKIIANMYTSRVRTFFDELKNQTDDYRSMNSMTNQITYDYHSRFLLELLQNAHDPLEQNGKVKIILDEDSQNLYVANTGMPFQEDNFRSITKLGQSTKDPASSIGNKGIGFKSVLEVTTTPYIYSGPTSDDRFEGFTFYFSQEMIQKLFTLVLDVFEHEKSVTLESITGYPDQLHDWTLEKVRDVKARFPLQNEQHSLRKFLETEIAHLSSYQLPLYVDEQDEFVRELCLEGYMTVIKLPLNKQNALEKANKAIHNINVDTLLFLPKLSNLQFVSKKDGQTTQWYFSKEIKKLIPNVERISMFHNGKFKKSFLYCNRTLKKVMPEFKEALELSDDLPKTWHQLKKVNVNIAIEESSQVPTGLFYIYFPTQEKTDMPYCVNAPFFADMSRKHINFEVPWNQFLAKQAGILLVDFIDSLSKLEPLPKNAIIDLLTFTIEDTEGDVEPSHLFYLGFRQSLKKKEIELKNWNVIPQDIPGESGLTNDIQHVYLVEDWDFLQFFQPDKIRKYNYSTLSNLIPTRMESLENFAELADMYMKPNDSDWARWAELVANDLLNQKVEISTWE